jgi:hypothetical protein
MIGEIKQKTPEHKLTRMYKIQERTNKKARALEVENARLREQVAALQTGKPSDVIDTTKLPAVAPKESAWCLLRCGSLVSDLEADDDGGFYLNDWAFYWTEHGYAFFHNTHERNPALDVILVISGEDMRGFLDSQIRKAAG